MKAIGALARECVLWQSLSTSVLCTRNRFAASASEPDCVISVDCQNALACKSEAAPKALLSWRSFQRRRAPRQRSRAPSHHLEPFSALLFPPRRLLIAIIVPFSFFRSFDYLFGFANSSLSLSLSLYLVVVVLWLSQLLPHWDRFLPRVVDTSVGSLSPRASLDRETRTLFCCVDLSFLTLAISFSISLRFSNIAICSPISCLVDELTSSHG